MTSVAGHASPQDRPSKPVTFARHWKRFTLSPHATSAVEFALIAPLLVMLVSGVTAYGAIISSSNAVEQLAAEGARATIAGLSDSERDSLARSTISARVASYPFLDPAFLAVRTASLGGSPAAYQLTLTYDLSRAPVMVLVTLLPLGSATTTIVRSAVVQVGGLN